MCFATNQKYPGRRHDRREGEAHVLLYVSCYTGLEPFVKICKKFMDKAFKDGLTRLSYTSSFRDRTPTNPQTKAGDHKALGVTLRASPKVYKQSSLAPQ